MALRDILVFLDEFEHTPDRLRLAADLAQAHGATLIGLRVEIKPRIPRQLRNAIVDEAMATHNASIRAVSERLRAALEEAAAGRGIASEWWSVEGGGIADIIERARYANLIVVNKHDRQDDEEFPADELIHEILVRSGRPALVAPNWPVTGVAGTRAVIAWNGSRESSRALADAMPLLEKTERAMLVIGENDETEATIARLSGHLARNGVTVGVKVLKGEDAIQTGGDILLSCNEIEANLLVIGGYGKSRLREKLFGGVTEFVLYHARLPLLMSH